MSDISLESLIRHPEFWFDDGSVVLVAQDTGFRVYRALLATHSTVLAGMLSSSTTSTEAKLEGCPVVYLSDSPQDVEPSLRVLFPNPQPIIFSSKCNLPFHQLSALVRLAHKYDAKAVLCQAFSDLHDLFPFNFDTWEHGDFATVGFKSVHPITAIGLALLVDKPSRLAAAFYQCALLGADILDGYTHEDVKVEHLNQSDLKRCIQGRNELAARALTMISDIFSLEGSLSFWCKTPDRCSPLLESVLQSALKDRRSGDANVLRSWKSRIGPWARDAGICGSCEGTLMDREVLARAQGSMVIAPQNLWYREGRVAFGQSLLR